MFQCLICVTLFLGFVTARPQLDTFSNGQQTSNGRELRAYGAPALENNDNQKVINEPLGIFEVPSKSKEDKEDPSGLYGVPVKNLPLNLEIPDGALDVSVPERVSGLYETPAEDSNQIPIVAFLDDEPDVNLDKGKDEPELPIDKATMMLMPFNYNWQVRDSNSENSFGHSASSDGLITQGEYSVLLPDGRLQIVQYSDDGTGYKVKISYT